MATLTRKNRGQSLAEPDALIRASNVRASSEQFQEAANAEALQGLLAYLKYLHSEGEISEGAYKTLISQALSTFAKNATYFRVEHLLEDVDDALEEVSQVILNSVFR